MSEICSKKYFIISFIVHCAVLLILILGFNFATPLPVLKNTNKNDVISAVILGDTQKSKIITEPQVSANLPKPEITPQPKEKQVPKLTEKVIAIKPEKPLKKITEKSKNKFKAEDLLADIKKQTALHQKKQKTIETQFQKTLKMQAEKSLRQDLMDEEIKLQGNQSREAQGVVNKYKALILQTISQHWIVPPGVNKKLYCELIIRIAPGGMVLDVQITKSSGDPALDSSARAAVLKSSPLPVPNDSASFEAFRQIILKVKPENILADNQLDLN